MLTCPFVHGVCTLKIVRNGLVFFGAICRRFRKKCILITKLLRLYPEDWKIVSSAVATTRVMKVLKADRLYP
jgi:hypothetical protein